MKLCKLRGDLCVGGMSLKHFDVFMDEDVIGTPANWSGQIQFDRAQQHSLELERQYLLILDQGGMAPVKLVSFRPDFDASTVLADFVACTQE